MLPTLAPQDFEDRAVERTFVFLVSTAIYIFNRSDTPPVSPIDAIEEAEDMWSALKRELGPKA